MKKINTVWLLFQPRQFAGVEKMVEKRGKFRAVRAAALVETKFTLVKPNGKEKKGKLKEGNTTKMKFLNSAAAIL